MALCGARSGFDRDRARGSAQRGLRRRAAGSACTPPRSRGRRARPRGGGEGSCSRRSVPYISRLAGRVNGTSSSRKRATSSIRSTSRVTSRARQLGTTTASPLRSKPSASRIANWRSGGRLEGRSGCPRATGRSLTTGRRGSALADVARSALSCPPASSSSKPARGSPAAASASWGSTPFSQRPEASLRRRWRSELRKIVVGSKFPASSRTERVSSRISVSAPPMIPASAIARSRSAITRSSATSPRTTPSSVVRRFRRGRPGAR